MESVSKEICTKDGGINADEIGEKPSCKQIMADSSPIFMAFAEFDGNSMRILVETKCGGASGNGGQVTAIGCGLAQGGHVITSDVRGEDGKVPSLSLKVLSLSLPMRT